MTGVVSRDGREHDPASRAQQAITLALATVLACALVVATSGDAWRWPFQYGDDLIFDIATWHYREEKLPGEARWIVWMWHEVFGASSPAADFRLSLVAWCLSMALIAQRLTTGARWPSIVCAVALSANPAVLRLLQWPHTAAPMMATMLMCSTLLFMSFAHGRRLKLALAVATCAAMLAFQLFALLLIAAALFLVTARTLRADKWDVRDLVRNASTVVLSGVAGTIAGLLLGYAFNAAAFGHFGLDIAGWRETNVGSGTPIARAAMNLREVLYAASDASGHLLWPVMLTAAGTWSVLALRQRETVRIVWLVLVLVLVLLLGVVMAPISATLLSGVPVPESRGGLTIWFAAIAMLVLLADMHAARTRVVAFGSMAVLTSTAVWLTGGMLATGSRVRLSHEVHLAVIAQDVRAALGATGPARTLVAVGVEHPFDSLGNNDEWWVRALLRSRLEPELVGSVIYCAVTPCEALRGQSLPDHIEAPPGYPVPGYLSRSGDVLMLRFRRHASSRPGVDVTHTSR